MPSIMEMNLNYTLGTQKIEKVNPSKDAIHLCKEMSKKNMSANEAVEAIKMKYRVDKGV
ncbi:hypothetical protein [Chakrabartyella piscis]|uniref:hypothetical protein n=1 Tax=Chakrabartyella piscis TaxID=2918914 RepID=UPI002958C060|nr:hypothetical protein [Chakrabartyella piscis]